MTEQPDLRPATPHEIAEALSFALRFNGRRPFPQASSLMAEITAAHLVEHLQRCGFLVLKGPDAIAPSASHHPKAGSVEPDKP
jgi:hypothetical protein